jgi:predicted NAD/FAD-dependent oxidoreductase
MTADDSISRDTGPGAGETPRVGVVGAGLSGLTCALRLREAGFPVTVIERSPTPGGRQSTRREDFEGRQLHFDHGAQYFTVRDPEFEQFLAPYHLEEPALVREWTVPVVVLEKGKVRGRSDSTRRYVFTPSMDTLTRRLSEEVPCRFRTEVTRLERRHGTWFLFGEKDETILECEVLVLSTPAVNALRLLPDDVPLAPRLHQMRYAPIWTLMVHFSAPLGQSFGGAFVDASPLSWIANNDTKPGREVDRGESWVLHGTPEWSHAHLETPGEEIAPAMLGALEDALGRSLPEPLFVRTHLWRLALPTLAANEPCLWSAPWRLGIAGDGCPAGARIEGAFTSGSSLARRIAEELASRD